jgi:hypothetical protein
MLAQLQAVLPAPSRATPELAAMLKAQNISNVASTAGITAVSYAEDGGGIMCRLETPANENAVYVSITYLRFDPRLPIAREIAAYQKTPRRSSSSGKYRKNIRDSHDNAASTLNLTSNSKIKEGQIRIAYLAGDRICVQSRSSRSITGSWHALPAFFRRCVVHNPNISALWKGQK